MNTGMILTIYILGILFNLMLIYILRKTEYVKIYSGLLVLFAFGSIYTTSIASVVLIMAGITYIIFRDTDENG